MTQIQKTVLFTFLIAVGFGPVAKAMNRQKSGEEEQKEMELKEFVMVKFASESELNQFTEVLWPNKVRNAAIVRSSFPQDSATETVGWQISSIGGDDVNNEDWNYIMTIFFSKLKDGDFPVEVTLKNPRFWTKKFEKLQELKDVKLLQEIIERYSVDKSVAWTEADLKSAVKELASLGVMDYMRNVLYHTQIYRRPVMTQLLINQAIRVVNSQNEGTGKQVYRWVSVNCDTTTQKDRLEKMMQDAEPMFDTLFSLKMRSQIKDLYWAMNDLGYLDEVLECMERFGDLSVSEMNATRIMLNIARHHVKVSKSKQFGPICYNEGYYVKKEMRPIYIPVDLHTL